MILLKRIFLFLALNLAIILSISIILNLLGIKPYLSSAGIDYQQLLAFCLVWGMGGSFISLALSRKIAKFTLGVKLIDSKSRDSFDQEILHMVYKSAKLANIVKMPEVGIYDSPEINAFATGPTKNRSLVALSTGLLNKMNKSEIEGVIGHEIAHISNGDMVTMTLIQGIVNAFVMFFSRTIAYVVSSLLRRSDDKADISPFLFHTITIVLDIVFMIFGSIIIAWFSRQREFKADLEGAKLTSKENMIAALKSLKKLSHIEDPTLPETTQTLKIANNNKLAYLFSTHPSLEERIYKLQNS